jgi:hypothetical protein
MAHAVVNTCLASVKSWVQVLMLPPPPKKKPKSWSVHIWLVNFFDSDINSVGERVIFSLKGAWLVELHTQNVNLNPYYIPQTKINGKGWWSGSGASTRA